MLLITIRGKDEQNVSESVRVVCVAASEGRALQSLRRNQWCTCSSQPNNGRQSHPLHPSLAVKGPPGNTRVPLPLHCHAMFTPVTSREQTHTWERRGGEEWRCCDCPGRATPGSSQTMRPSCPQQTQVKAHMQSNIIHSVGTSQKIVFLVEACGEAQVYFTWHVINILKLNSIFLYIISTRDEIRILRNLLTQFPPRLNSCYS